MFLPFLLLKKHIQMFLENFTVIICFLSVLYSYIKSNIFIISYIHCIYSKYVFLYTGKVFGAVTLLGTSATSVDIFFINFAKNEIL